MGSPETENPSVLVLLVVTDGARWLPDVLRGLRAQRYRPLRVIAVDNASSDGSGELLVKAFGATRVVTLERRVGYGRALAAALKVAAERKMEADAFLLLHDDCMLMPGSVEALAEHLGVNGVGIVGSKLVDWDDPTLLQDIGQRTDRYGRLVPRVERGELDQGQHDGIHEVLYASSAAMLVSRDVVERVGLFDMRYVALRDDLDLCWRARLAGFKTVVTTGSAGKHVAASARDVRRSAVQQRTRYFGERNMLATLIKNYSALRLVVVLPVAFALSILNALLFLISGRRASAIQVLEAIQWNIVHLPSTLRARMRVQRARTVRDAEVTALMHHGATRLRAQFERAVEKVVGEVEEGSDEDLDRPPPRLIDRARAYPTATLMLIALVVGTLGARALFFDAPMAGVDFGPFPRDATDFFTAYGSGWRGAGMGGAAPATPGLILLGLLSLLCLGSTWLAQRLLILGLPLLGALTMFRLARAAGLTAGARRLAVVLYLLSPLTLAAFGGGRLHDLLVVAAAPGLLLPLLRAARVLPDAGWRSLASGTLGLALAASLAPWTLILVLLCGSLLAAASLAGPKPSSAPVLRRTATMIGGALVLLLPWSPELFRRGSPLFAGGAEQTATMLELLALSPSPVRPYPVILGGALVLGGLVGLLVVPAERRRLAGTLAAIAAPCLLLAWGVARGLPLPAPRPGLLLVPLAIAAVMAAAAGYASAGEALATRTFGLRHVAVGIAGGAVLALCVFGAGWVAGGDRPGLRAADELLPSFFAADAATSGDFRIAWIGGTIREPTVALTGVNGATMTDYLARPAGAGATAARRAVGVVAGHGGELAGRMLATLGVRYVIVRPEADPALVEAVASQVDLSFYQRFRTASVFRNEVGLPAAAAVSGRWAEASGGSLESAAGAGSKAAAVPLRRTDLTGFAGRSAGGGRILIAEDYSAGWRAEIGGRRVAPRRSFGWGTRFDAPARAGSVRVSWNGQRWHRAALVAQTLIALAFLVAWSQRAARERGER